MLMLKGKKKDAELWKCTVLAFFPTIPKQL